MSLILGTDMNVGVSIETYVTYDKPLIERKNDRGTYLNSGQNLRIIFLKLETHKLNLNWIKT